MNEQMQIELLDHASLSVAARIHTVQMAAYAQEARLIGATHFPPLLRTVEDVRTSNERFFGAFLDEELAGVASVEVVHDWHTCIASLVVLPRRQRRAIGVGLLRHLIGLFGCHRLSVRTAARNVPALALYRRCGFTEMRRWRVGDEPLELVMLQRPAPTLSPESVTQHEHRSRASGQTLAMPTFFQTADDFRTWLTMHGADESALLVGFHKIGSGRPSMTWPESGDEALCFGWIDGVRKRIDDGSYSIRFTPRKTTLIWSAINIAKFERLRSDGRMTAAGQQAYAHRKDDRSVIYAYE